MNARAKLRALLAGSGYTVAPEVLVLVPKELQSNFTATIRHPIANIFLVAFYNLGASGVDVETAYSGAFVAGNLDEYVLRVFRQIIDDIGLEL